MPMNFYDESWALQPQMAPCDLHFLEWLEKNHVRNAAIFHFGTGAHHTVGTVCAENGSNNAVLGITASPYEYKDYIKLAIAKPEITQNYKVLFGDIYLLNDRLLPRFDIVTLFHLCEYWRELNASYGAMNDLQMATLLLNHLKPYGHIIFYKGSSHFAEAEPLIEEIRRTRNLTEIDQYKSLVVFQKPGDE